MSIGGGGMCEHRGWRGVSIGGGGGVSIGGGGGG